MDSPVTLRQFLLGRGREHAAPELVPLMEDIAQATRKISFLVSQGALGSALGSAETGNVQGEVQKKLDIIANEVMVEALSWSGHWAGLVSEEMADPVAMPSDAKRGRYLCLFDPLDGSSNIDSNATIGTIFSILPHVGPDSLLQPGVRQLAAGFLLYGPQVALVLTVGEGTQIFVLERSSGQFIMVEAQAKVPAETSEYAINGSNARHWDSAIRYYVEDCQAGAEGPRAKDFNTRWVASMVADVFRILARGGIYLYPGDARKGYTQGRLRLVYEANPVAFIMEQAGAAATDCRRPILQLQPTHLHQRVPLVFGSRAEVERVARYHSDASAMPERSPLFGRRGLLRA